MPGVRERLEEARALGLRAGIASSSDRSWLDPHLTRFELLSYFESIRCASDGYAAKPSPELYVAALDGLGCNSDEALALEDSPNGIAAAKAAGIGCIAIPNDMTRRLDLSAADTIVTSLAEVSLVDLQGRWDRSKHA
jgi:HAD superfamily hydrolase (TIGR01509 family)